MEPELETIACDLCGAADAERLLVASDLRYGVPGEFPIVRCRGCGLVYTNPRPTPRALARYYPDRYEPHTGIPQHASRAGATVRSLAFHHLPGALGNVAAWLYNTLAYRALVRGRGRVLDIGCGTGDFLAVWRELGWEVEGIEPSAVAAEAARTRLAAPVHVGFVEDAPLADAAFDLVTMSHSLEHVRSPRAVLRRVRRALAPGGRLLAIVPNFAAWDRRAFGARWHGLEVPRHLYHFEPATLRALLEAEDFTVEQLGGSAHADGVMRDLGRTRRTLAARALGIALLPVAAVRRSSSLWVIARRGRAARPAAS